MNRYVRSGAVTVLKEEITEDATYILFVVEEAPSDVHISKESVVADLVDAMKLEEERQIETLNDLKQAFLTL